MATEYKDHVAIFGGVEAAFVNLTNVVTASPFLREDQIDAATRTINGHVPVFPMSRVNFRLQVLPDKQDFSKVEVVAWSGNAITTRSVAEDHLDLIVGRLRAEFAGGDRADEQTTQTFAELAGVQQRSLEAVAADVIQAGKIDEKQRIQIGLALYKENRVDAAEVATLFKINDALVETDPEWEMFFLNAVLDHFYFREKSAESFTPAEEQQLIRLIEADDRIDERTELKILLHIMNRVDQTSAAFHGFVLEKLQHSILDSDTNLYGNGTRQKGAVDADDVAALKLALYGTASDGGLNISKTEAEYLFAIDRATADAKNDPAWPQLFKKAIAKYLLHEGPSPDRVDAEEQAWLGAEYAKNADGKPTKNQAAAVAYVRELTAI